MLKRILPPIIVIIASFFSVFHFNKFAFEHDLKYRPLANGWVSIYPGFHLDSTLTVGDKIKKIVDSDLVHGRFRPAFFTYISSSYFLSPILHKRMSELGNRDFSKLMTGDLRIFSLILLSSVSLSLIMISFLVYRYTGTWVYSFLPILFVPLSLSLTENLLQNYIDSQEIPLVFWCSLWFYFFFSSIYPDITGKKQALYWALSLIALTIAFLTKETTIVLAGVTGIQAIISYLHNTRKESLGGTRRVCIASTFLITVLLAGIVIYITMHNKTGYAGAYKVDVEGVVTAVKEVWKFIARFSLVHPFGYLAVFLGIATILFNRRREIYDSYASVHFQLFLTLFLSAAGFYAIILPWRPFLMKYTFPTVFFFSFLVAFSLALIDRSLKQKIAKFRWIIVFCLLTPFLVLFFSIQKKATVARDYIAVEANYGVSILPQIAKDIVKVTEETGKETLNVMVLYQAGEKWRNSIAWSGLHLMRWLNFEHGMNIIDKNGNVINELTMQKNKLELTSFKYDTHKPSVYIAENKSKLLTRPFDVIYQAYLDKETPVQMIDTPYGEYQQVARVAEYPKKPFFQPFIVYRYLLSH